MNLDYFFPIWIQRKGKKRDAGRIDAYTVRNGCNTSPACLNCKNVAFKILYFVTFIL